MPLTLNNSTVSSNSAMFGGGIYGSAGGFRLTLNNSTVSGNSARIGGGILNSGGQLTLSNSTVSGNSARIAGGISNSGFLTLSNSTVSGNSANSRGGGIWNRLSLTLNNSTVSGNNAGAGGGIFNDYVSNVTLARSLVSGNTAGSGSEIYNEIYSSDYYGIVVSNDYNLIGHSGNAGTSGFTPSRSDIVPMESLSAILDTTLAYNGGSTQTHALVPGSHALDAIPATDPACTGTDQRGVARPQGDGCDIGAFELAEDPVSTADLLAFFDQAVAAGTLTGVGSGQVAALRLKAVRLALVLAHELVERDRVRWACAELLLALGFTDGHPRPRDLVTGAAAPELARLIMDVRTALGCE